jgi:glutathione synthase/RimK-type ligase-like ATP-grasp enzyme
MMEAAVKATKALKMDFGAVDILFNRHEGIFVVLEVNSMPDISSYERVSGIRLARLVSEWAERA